MAYKGKLLKDMKGAERQARIQALIRAGNTAAIPTAYLPASLARKRALNARLDAPVVPGSGLTNRGLAHEAEAATRLQYGPQEQALAQQLASARNQPAYTGGYYDTYINELRRAAAAQPTQTAALVAQQQALGGAGSSGQQAATGQNQALLASMQADAAKRGAQVDPGLAQTFAQGTAVNTGLADARAGTAGLLGQVQGNYLQGLIAAAEIGKASALNEVAGRTNDLMGQQTQLRGAEGAFNVQYRQKRRGEEGQNVLNTALAESTIGSRAAAAKTAAENVKVRRTTARTQAQLARDRLTETARHNKTSEQIAQERARKAAAKKAGKKTQPTAGPGSLTRSEENKRASQINQIADVLLHPPKIKDDKGKTRTATRDEIIAEIRSGTSPLGKGVDPNVIAAGDSLAKNGKRGLGPYGVNAAYNAGVHVNGRWKKIKAAKKAKGNSVGATVEGVKGAAGSSA